VYNANVVAIKCDNKKIFSNNLINITKELGILYKLALARIKKLNRLIKRASEVLT
jgi:hypothetical protein